MTKNIISGVCALLFLGLILVPHAHAETTNTTPATTGTSVTVMMEKIKALMAQLEDLKKQLATARGEVKDTLKAGIPEGTNSDDVKKIHELLATDPAIYPEGKVTGYFGPLTKDAIKRFQTRHSLDATGIVDDETKSLLEEYLNDRKDGKVPHGLLHAPGIMKKMEERMNINCKPTTEMHDGDEDHMQGDMHHGTSTKQGETRMMMRGGENMQKSMCKDMKEHSTSTEKMPMEHEMNPREHATTTKDKENNQKTVTEAQKAIHAAEMAIRNVEQQIDHMGYDAPDKVKDSFMGKAKAKIKEARKALENKDSLKARDLAQEAEDFAKKVEDSL